MFTRSGRPLHINLLRIELPIAGLVSIGHRISGLMLIAAIPIALYLLQLSLSGESGFERAGALLKHPGVLAVLLIAVWALVHHVLAGLRYLAIDLGIGVDLGPARRSAWVVWFSGLIAAALFALYAVEVAVL